ncbi:MAG: hypothetical protein GY803_09930 [Chloroflexi bacterium]|nr:hypothetical protein [Chloroflexota bacterium]
MSKILLATLGLSPGVVTGAYFSLLQEGQEIDHVVTVTTDHPTASLCEALIEETLAEANPDLVYEPLRGAKAETLADVHDAAFTFIRFLDDLLEELATDNELYVVVSGGRTSMAAAAMLTLQKYLIAHPAANLHVYHLEVVNPDFDKFGSITELAGRLPKEQAIYLKPDPRDVALVDIPLRWSLPIEWIQSSTADLLAYAVGEYLLHQSDYVRVRFQYNPDYLNGEKTAVYAERITDEIALAEKADPNFRRLLLQSFGQEDLRTLCFDLMIDYDDLPAQGRENKARELILYMERRGRLPELLAACEQKRPIYHWAEAVRLRQILLCDCLILSPETAVSQLPPAIDSLHDKMEAAKEATHRPVEGWLVVNNLTIPEPIAQQAAEKGIAIKRAANMPQQDEAWQTWRLEQWADAGAV